MASKGKSRDNGMTGSRLADWRKRVAMQANFINANAPLLLAAIHYMAEAGGAIRFGKTRDGGAIAIGLYDGDEKRTEYLAPDDDIDQLMIELLELYAPPDVVREYRDWMAQARIDR